MHSGAGEERTMTCGTGEGNIHSQIHTHTATPAVILSDRVVDFVTSIRDQAGVLHPVRSEITSASGRAKTKVFTVV